MVMLLLLYAVRLASGGRWDVFEYLDAQLVNTGLRGGGGRFVKVEEALPVTFTEQVKQGVMGQVGSLKEVVEGNGENVAKGAMLGVPAVLMGAGWMRAQRIRGRGGVRRGT
jgi:hypothetical protein